MARDQRLLVARHVVAGYGGRAVLRKVNLEVDRAEIVALVGHNGAGKSTFLRAAFGLIPLRHGLITFDTDSVHSLTPRGLRKKGMVFLPQGQPVFDELTVLENIQVAALILSNRASRMSALEFALDPFPSLRPRLQQVAGTLSGGEKQLVALAAALVSRPSLLLLDEPSLGLAPPMVDAVLEHVAELRHHSEVSILIVEQKVRQVLDICSRAYILKHGEVAFAGDPSALEADRMREAYL